jgi:nucleotide-binding universal stress UspA family protein
LSAAEEDDSMRTLSQIVLALDFDEACTQTAAAALQLARALDAQVHVVHALHIPHVQNLAAVPPAMVHDAVVSAEHRLLATTQALPHAESIRSRTVRRGDVATQIVQAARELDAELIVIGERSRSRVARMLLGSVAPRVTNEAPCAVLVIKLGDERKAHS